MNLKPWHFNILAVLLLSFDATWATHLVGGEITYTCLGNNDYEIEMIIYRDGMSTGAQFDQQAVISIYDVNNNLIANRRVDLLTVVNLPLAAPNNCTTLPNNVATEKGLYIDTVNLPPIQGGYVISHQRCCRNNTITNINNSTSNWGTTYTTSIPSMDNCNSSAKFIDDPPVVLCLNQRVDLDLSAQDSDGDSLYYELCSMLNGGSNTHGNVMPDPAAPPPYMNVPFINGYSISNPITSRPSFSINGSTGILSGRPTQVGQFVFAICVSEYDSNGMRLSTTRRDFQFNISNACKIILSKIKGPAGNILTYHNPDSALNNPVLHCSGRRVQFESRAQYASSYYWDFGDTAVYNDTSRFANPTFTYRDTGKYLVMHVAEPYTDCADTAYALYNVYDSTTVNFTFTGEVCLDENQFDFQVEGRFSKYASFQWDFDGATNLGGSSTLKEPQDVSWLKPGKHYVRVVMSDFTCQASFGDTVEIFSNPVADEEVEPARVCAPYSTRFFDRSTAYGPVQHFWYFGDGHTSHEVNPTHTYHTPGLYTVEHVIKTFQGCRDSSYSRHQNVIEVLPVPRSDLQVSAEERSIYNPNFEIRNASSHHSATVTYFA
ncbi:MAG: PKD domain-containing protein [Owenweeksia sp.]|nr:PKD domain-containing protein [Owenweeksia sp.]